MEDLEVELLGPPVPVGGTPPGRALARHARHRTLRLIAHRCSFRPAIPRGPYSVLVDAVSDYLPCSPDEHLVLRERPSGHRLLQPIVVHHEARRRCPALAGPAFVNPIRSYQAMESTLFLFTVSHMVASPRSRQVSSARRSIILAHPRPRSDLQTYNLLTISALCSRLGHQGDIAHVRIRASREVVLIAAGDLVRDRLSALEPGHHVVDLQSADDRQVVLGPYLAGQLRQLRYLRL